MRPLYKLGKDVEPKDRAHRGLWYDKFCNRWDEQWTLGAEKKEWIKTVAGPCGDEVRLKQAALQRQRMLSTVFHMAEPILMEITGPFVTGLGQQHPVENGFLWHHTLGVPYLPGSSVKGLVRGWVEGGWEDLPESQRRERLLDWFGSDAKQPQDRAKPARAGRFILFDAIPVSPVRLACDIMTPHMGAWYSDGAIRAGESDTIPADWHDPTPIPFLVVEKATFAFAIAPRKAEYASELGAVNDILVKALTELGAGAKTAVGYGRMTADDDALNMYRDWVEAIREAEERRRQLKLSEAQRMIERFQALDGASVTLVLDDARNEFYGLRSRILKQAVKWKSAKERTKAADALEAHFEAKGWGRGATELKRRQTIAILRKPRD
jgi:CRISPR-associated protein Cmr6